MSFSLAFFFVCTPLAAQVAAPEAAQITDLTSLNMEDLMNIKVTSVSKTQQKLSRTASAVFILSQTEIVRSGAQNIPDLLRMVPGVDVAQIGSNTWAISARGLNDEFANELLVLVDGRDVYTPTFGGVLWALLDLPLEDVERIEVIRGPGGSIWGGNAVNGVINIITKTAEETHGGMVVAGEGNLNQGFATAQYGGRAGKDTDFRIFLKYLNQSSSPGANGQGSGDAWHNLRGGFRSDSTLSPSDSLMFQGDIFTGREGEITSYLPSISSPGLIMIPSEAGESGGFLQSVWKHTNAARSETTLSASYSSYKSDDVFGAFAENRKTLGVDFQHHATWGARQDFVWGLGYQYSTSHSMGNLTVSLNPANLGTQLFSSFIQDGIALLPDQVYLKVGAKLDIILHRFRHHAQRSSYGRVEQTADAVGRRLAGRADPGKHRHRNPRQFRKLCGPGGIPVENSLVGNPGFQSEGLIAYEMGYRTSLSSRLSIDFSAYYNDYSTQQTIEPAAGFLENSPTSPSPRGALHV